MSLFDRLSQDNSDEFYYAGIGSRETPRNVTLFMERLAAKLELNGGILRSGHAPGADQAFERGANRGQIFLPWKSFERSVIFPPYAEIYAEPISDFEYEVAAAHHPHFKYLKQGAKKLMARNTSQIFGPEYPSEDKKYRMSEFVVCWTKDASGKGGTGQAIRIAKRYGIPVYDLGDKFTYAAIEEAVDKWT